MDLYRLLGVKPSATAEQIQKAFRRKARKAHPDAGGDPEKFRELKRAYDLLSDPSRRSRYDATGDESERGPDNSGGSLFQLLQGVFIAVVQPHVQMGNDPANVPVIEYMKQALLKRRKELKDIERQIDRAVEAVVKIKEGLSRKGAVTVGEDLLAAICDRQREAMKGQREVNRREDAEITTALEVLDTYEYRVDGVSPGFRPRPRLVGWAATVSPLGE